MCIRDRLWPHSFAEVTGIPAEYPDLNANVLEENVVRHFNTVNLGFACDTPRGLIVPTIFNADQMTLLELLSLIHISKTIVPLYCSTSVAWVMERSNSA